MTEMIEEDELRRHIVDPRELTGTERAALERIDAHELRRVKGGFRLPGDPRTTTLATVNALMKRGLVRYVTTPRGRFLAVTARGQETIRLIVERRRKYHAGR